MKSSSLECVRPAWWLAFLSLLAAATPALGQGADFRFDSDGVLPSSQGAIHVATSGLKESAVYSAKKGYLTADTLGTGAASYYVVERHFNHAFPATLDFRAQVTQNDGQAVVISLASDSDAWSFNLANNGVEIQQKGGWILAVPMDTRDRFHTYRIEIAAARPGFDLYVDDVLLYSGEADRGKKNSSTLTWGDTAAREDGKVVWDTITLTHRPPFSLTLPSPYSRVVPLFDQTKAAKAGKTLPLSLQLLDAIGANVSSPDLAAEAVDLVRVSSSAPGSLIEVESGPADSNFRYDPTVGKTGGYIYNFTTAGLDPGTYNLVFNVGGDTTPHKLQFQIR